MCTLRRTQFKKQIHIQTKRNFSRNTVIHHLFSILIVNSLLILWFYSPLPSSIGKYFLNDDKIITLDDLLDWVCIRNHLLADLLSCWICMSFWLSLIIGTIISITCSLSWYFPIICFWAYPPILFAIKQQYR